MPFTSATSVLLLSQSKPTSKRENLVFFYLQRTSITVDFSPYIEHFSVTVLNLSFLIMSSTAGLIDKTLSHHVRSVSGESNISCEGSSASRQMFNAKTSKSCDKFKKVQKRSHHTIVKQYQTFYLKEGGII